MSYFGPSVRNGGPIGLGTIISLLSTKQPSPSLALNFTSGVLGSQVTFTRASSATYYNSAGVLTLAAVNAPRFDYNPTTLQPRGLLIEETRANLLLNSLINGTNLTTQTVTVTAVPTTLSFYGTGTIVLSGAAVATIVGTGAYPSRQTYTFTPTAGALIVTVTGTVQFAQLEVGAFALSYIPTAGTAVTRAQDFASITTLTPWYNATEGTLMAVATPYSPVTSTIKILAAFDDGTFAQRAQIVKTSGTSFVNGVVTVGTAVYTGSVTTPWAIDTIGKAALAYKSSNNQVAFNGVLDLVAVSTPGVPTVTKLAIGARYDGGTPWSGAIGSISYYPRRLTNAELASITA